MLRIKEERLKDLEKFGFIEKTHFWYNELRVNKHNGIIEVGNYRYSPYFNLGKSKYNIPNILYDLIKSDMVEKVEENNG